jgi:diguanylate cyclase (GGDEF)-like protein
MQILVHQQMNIISFVILFLFLIYANSVIDRKSTIRKVYLASLNLNLVLIFLEVIFNFIISSEYVSAVFLRIIGGVSFALMPLISYLFLLFVCNYFSHRYKIKWHMRYFHYFLLVINAIVAMTSLKTDLFVSARGSKSHIITTAYVMPFLLSLIFIAYSIFVIHRRKKTLLGFEFVYILSVSLLAGVVTVAQLAANKTGFMWCFSSFISILMFIIIQQKDLYRDSLTGARNRLALKKCLDSYTKRPGGKLSVILMDLDYFKNINDSYGHSEGDYALKMFVKILQKTFLNKGIVIRMGGDEFLTLVYDLAETEINDLMKKVSKMVERFNNKGEKPYRLKYSYAFGAYNKDAVSIDQFLHEIDIRMYNNKNGKKGCLSESLQSGFYAGNL